MKRISWRKHTSLVSREAYLAKEKFEYSPRVLRFFSDASRFTLHTSRLQNAGFSLLELIGVVAIIAILGTVIAPNVIKHLNVAARSAEVDTLEGIAHAIEVYLRENRSWPPDLVTLSPDYLPTNTVQLAQNDAGFPRYFFVHPDISGITNATGLSNSELDDAQFLLISNLKADASPTLPMRRNLMHGGILMKARRLISRFIEDK